MAVYFTIYTFSDLLFIPWIFFSTRVLTTKGVIFGVLILEPLIYTNIPSQLVTKMIQVTAHDAVQPTASDDTRIISKSGIRVYTRKGHHCECGTAGTAAQLVVSGHN